MFSRFILVILAMVPIGLALAQDAEDAYEDARDALNQRQFDEAIEAFQALRRDYPDSSYVGDSYYWEALALERNGEPERAVEAIDRLLREYPDASTADDAAARRIRVCSELARRGDRECAELVASVVRDPNQLDEPMKMMALNALINMRAERAIPIASRVAANRNQLAAVRNQALFVLADKADEASDPNEVLEVLRSIALDQTDDSEVRAQAIFWLSEVPGEATLDLLTEFVNGTADRELKNRAIFAISQHEDPRAISLLRQYAENESLDAQLRKQAIFWIGEEGEEQSLPFLTELFANLADAELRQQVLFAVSKTHAAGSAEWLLERARDETESRGVRQQALFWAAESGLSVDELNALYEGFDDSGLREYLIWLIAENGGRGSFESLLDIARNDPDSEMRSKAVFWIGESDDPRAAEFILELLEQ